MTWPFVRRRLVRGAEAGRVTPGAHASPGLRLLVESWERRPPRSILDLGPTSTESLAFLTAKAENVEVWDLFQSAGEWRAGADGRSRVRADVFRFDLDEIELPDALYDVILAWDLLHYFRPEERVEFGRDLGDLAADGALLHLLASNIAPIPATPIHFKILGKRRGRDGDDYHVDYVLPSDPEFPTPGLPTRQVEAALPDFRPIRHFQLRNGLQELVFQRKVEPE